MQKKVFLMTNMLNKSPPLPPPWLMTYTRVAGLGGGGGGRPAAWIKLWCWWEFYCFDFLWQIIDCLARRLSGLFITRPPHPPRRQCACNWTFMLVRGIAHQHCARHCASTLCTALRINSARHCTSTFYAALRINIVRGIAHFFYSARHCASTFGAELRIKHSAASRINIVRSMAHQHCALYCASNIVHGISHRHCARRTNAQYVFNFKVSIKS